MSTNRDYGNMLNQTYVKTQSPPRKKKKKTSPWVHMKEK